MRSRKELQEEIIFLKGKLIQIGYEKGLTHVSTIQASQKLDRLINEYVKLTHPK